MQMPPRVSGAFQRAPSTPKSLRAGLRDRPPLRAVSQNSIPRNSPAPAIFIEKKHMISLTVPVVDDWRPRPAPRCRRRTKNPSPATRARCRAQARRKWPTYMPDVAYALEGVPQPKRQHGRTWAEVARDEFLSSITLGVPPWASEAWRPEHRPPVIAPGELAAGLPPEILASLTEKERASLYWGVPHHGALQAAPL